MRRGPVLLWLLTTALVVVGVLFAVVGGLTPGVVLFGLLALNLATVGALVLRHQPDNRIGWVFLLFGLYVAVEEIVEGYLLLATDLHLPGDVAANWFTSWSWAGEGMAWAFVAAMFPNGRLLGSRWRWIPWAATVGFVLSIGGVGFGSAYDDFYQNDVNPLRIDSPVVDALLPLGTLLLVGAVGGAAATLLVRLRRSKGVERQQLKWFVFACFGVVVSVAAASLFWADAPTLVEVGLGITFNAVPAAAGVAILRYRLYDIDLVINRTLVYGALTATLAIVYLSSVLLLRLALEPLTGRSDLAVAASTLAVAALFRPLRSRIQTVVDRRFYRRRYDAARTLESFGGRLRQQVDLDTVTDDLRSVVRDTVQPAHVSLWLRGAAHGPAVTIPERARSRKVSP
jgi:hypothetical protein